MATRYYFPVPGSGSAAAPVSTIPVGSQWNETAAGFLRGHLVTTKLGTALTAESSANFAELTATPGNMIHKQYVSDPIVVDQTISGTFTLVMRCGQGTTGGTSGAADMSLQCVVRVVGADGTERGVLYNGHNVALTQASGAVGQEMASTTQVRLMNGITLTPVDALIGDRVVVEIGHRAHNTITGTYYSYLHLGDSAAADHALGTTTQSAPGWFEFSADVGHGSSGDTVPITSSGSATASTSKRAQGTGTSSSGTVSATSTGDKGNSTVYDWTMDGTDGADVVTAGSEFGTVSKPAGSSIKYREAGSWKGQYIEFDSLASSTAPGVFSTMSPTKATLLGRTYFRYYANPPTDAQIVKIRGTTLAQRLTLRISTTGKLQLFNGTTVLAESPSAVPTNQWVRIEFAYLTTTMSCRYFTDPRSDTPTWSSGSVTAVSDSITSPLIGIGNATQSWKVDFDHTTFDSIDYPAKVDRPNGSGTVSGLAIFAKSGTKIAKGAWGIVDNAPQFTSTGDKSGVVTVSGTGTLSGASTLAGAGKKRALGAVSLTTVADVVAVLKKIAKGTANLGTLSGANLYGDAESGTLSGFAVTAGASATSAAARNGTYGYRLDAVASGAYLNWDNTNVEQTHEWAAVSAWVRVNSHAPAETVDIISVKNTNGINHFDLFMTTDNRFKWDLLISDQAQTPIQSAGWHYVEARVYFGATTYTAQVRIDGVEQTAISSTGQVATTARSFWFGTPNAKTYQLDLDDIRAQTSETDPGYIGQNIHAYGKKIAKGLTTLSGTTGQSTGTASKRTSGLGVIGSISVLAQLGTKIAKGGPALPLVAVTTTLGSSGVKARVTVTGTITGTSAVTGVGRKIAKGTPSVSGSGTFPVAGRKRAQGNGDVYDAFVLASLGGRGSFGSGTGLVTGTLGATSAGAKRAKGTASLSGIWSLAKQTRKRAQGGDLSISGVTSGPTSPLGAKRGIANPVLSGTVQADSLGTKVAQAGLNIVSGTIDTDAIGRKLAKGMGSRSETGVFTVTGRKVSRGTGLVSGSGGMTSSGNSRQTSLGAGAVSGNAVVTTTGSFKRVGGFGEIDHVAVFAANGIKRGRGTGSYAGSITSPTVGGKRARGSSVVAGTVSGLPLGRKVGKGTAALYGEASTDNDSGRMTKSGMGSMTTVGILAAFGNIRDPRQPIRIGGKSNAVLIGSSLSVAVPVGGYMED